MTGEEALLALTESVRRCAEGANQDKLPASILLEYSEAARNFAHAADLLASALAQGATKVTPVRKVPAPTRYKTSTK